MSAKEISENFQKKLESEKSKVCKKIKKKKTQTFYPEKF